MTAPHHPSHATARTDAEPSERGIEFEEFFGARVYYAVASTGQRLPFIGVPIGSETDRDVIARLADSLDAADPLPPSPGGAAPRLALLHGPAAPSSPGVRPALRLVPPEPLRSPHR